MGWGPTLRGHNMQGMALIFEALAVEHASWAQQNNSILCSFVGWVPRNIQLAGGLVMAYMNRFSRTFMRS